MGWARVPRAALSLWAKRARIRRCAAGFASSVFLDAARQLVRLPQSNQTEVLDAMGHELLSGAEVMGVTLLRFGERVRDRATLRAFGKP